ncbi:MAG: tandem-95 repeat protein, partial [Comamonadaceae bacterium]
NATSVLANDSDVDGDALTAILVSGPAHGTLVLNADGTFSYTHDGSETTSDSFTYKVNDGTVDGNTVTVSIMVGEVNNAPVAVDDAVTVDEDTVFSSTVSLIANDTDSDSANLSAVAGTFATTQGGTLVMAADGSYTYTPPENFNGVDTVSYTVTDGFSTDVGTLTITVSPVNDTPTGAAAPVTGQEDQPINGTVVGADVDGDTLSYAVTTAATSGTVTIDPVTGAYTYTPNANFSGSDTFTVTISDGQGGTVQVPVSVTVNPVNDAPTGAAAPAVTNEDQPVNGTVVGADVDGDTLSYAVTTAATSGTVTVDPATGAYTYTPNANFNGSDTFTVTISDGQGGSVQVPVNVTVNPVNDAPTGTAAPTVTNEDQPVNGTVVGTDVDGDTLSYAVTTPATNGTVAIDPVTGAYTYTPNANFSGSDTFTVTISDGQGGTVQVPVSVTVNPVNDAPTGTAAPAVTNEDQSVNGTVVGTDVDGGTLSYAVTTPATNGTVTIDPATGAYTYTPNANFNGSDTFTVTISDGQGGTVQVPVSVTVNAVNDAPTGTAAPVTGQEDQAVNGTVVGADVDGDTLSYAVTTAATNGTVTIDPVTGAYTYTPNANFNGSDTFTVTISDGQGGTVQVPVSVTVNPGNDAPTGTATPTLTNEDQAVNGTVVGADVDGDTLSYAVTTAATSGTVTIDPVTGAYTYTPNANFNGNDTFTVTISDGQGGTVQVPVSVTVNAVNDAPTGTAAPAVTNEDQSVNGTVVGSDVDGDTLSYAVTALAASGTVTIDPATGAYTYTPNVNFNGSDIFTVTISDGQGGTVQVPVNVTVNPVNDAPTGTTAPVTGQEDQPINGTVVGADVEGDTLSYAVTTPAASGTVTIDPATGAYTYTPNANFNGNDTFTVTISDGNGGTVQVPVVVTVNAVNDAPVAVGDSLTVMEGGTATVLLGGATSVLANDSDVDGDTLTAAIVSGPAHGTLTLNADGTFSYTHDGSETTSDSFTYKVNDGTVDGNTVTVSITVGEVNNAPVAVDDAVTVVEDTTYSSTVSLIANDTDTDGPSLSAIAGTFTTAQGGTIVIAADGSYTYTPAANFNGTDTVTYTVTDGFSTDVGTLTLTVGSVNDAPAGADKTVTINEDTTYTFSAADFALTDANDTPSNALQSVIISTLPAAGQGQLLLNGVAVTAGQSIAVANIGQLTYVPAANANGNGLGAFTFQVMDNGGTASGGQNTDQSPNTFNFNVTPVNDAPTGTAAPVTGQEDQAVNGTVVGADVDGDTLSYAVATPATNGTVTLDPATGAYTYTPNANFSGSDTFTVTISDGQGGTVQVPVSVTVNAVNDAPTGTATPAVTNEDQPINGTVVGADVDGDTLSYAVTTPAANGTVAIDPITGEYTYTPNPNFNGSDTFTVTISDGQGGTVQVPVSVTVNAVNDAPTGTAAPAVTNEDQPVNGTVVSADVDGDALSYAVTAPAANGTVTVDPATGAYTYTPNANFNGSDTFTVTISDGQGGTVQVPVSVTVNPVNDAPTGTNPNFNGSDTFTVTISDGQGGTVQVPVSVTVNPVNDAPTGTTAPVTGQEDQPINGMVVGADVDGDTLSYSVTTPAANGTVTVDPATGAYTYTPAPNFNGTDTFTVTISDGQGGTVQVPVAVTVNAVNDAPTGTATPATTNEDQPVNGMVVGTDVDGDTLSYAVTTPATNGTVTIDPATGAYTYTPALNFNGSDTFTVTISDGQGGTVQVPVSVTVSAVNDAPTGTAAPATTNEDQPVNGTVAGTDVDGDTLSYSVTTLATNGTVTVDPATGAYTYTPNPNFNGSDTFTVTISDGQGGTVQVPVSVTV